MTYSPEDYPFTFFFCGEVLSGWAAQWSLVHKKIVSDSDKCWDEFIDLNHLWHLVCRIDHVGNIESEDSGVFRVCSQHLLIRLLEQSDLACDAVREALGSSHDARTVYNDLVLGLLRMITVAQRTRFVLWTSGYENDQKKLKDVIARVELPRGHPRFLELPHVLQRQEELARRCSQQGVTLRKLAQAEKRDKTVRKQLLELNSNGAKSACFQGTVIQPLQNDRPDQAN